ncbi:hypothetical protein BKK47_02765 [Rodentibacter mrazii]|uniref:Uncharacterized protein n=1 Tax=Rodentibacter mrazii TaxID=1908257 RepID=A0A1V3II59_9PAST|nr:hypothetical protein [Rodentibacter mrazii]OOF40845.1 hypothetical protein BKK47_02765 [Rodentibacter mrazii]
MKVNFSEAFRSGTANNRQFVDMPFLSKAQKNLIFVFARDVMLDKALVGKNKPSWLDDNLDEIPNTENYQANHFWHYHCGEFDPGAKVRRLTYQLQLNLEGLTSAAVLHYRKVSQEEITIVGFSPIHIPFPKEDDPDNPLFD